MLNNSPSTGESEPSLLKLNPPRNPGGENWGGLSCLWGNWRPSRRALMSGNWGSWANIGGIPGSVLPPERKGEGGKGNAGLAAVSLARSAALAAMFSLRGRGLGRRPAMRGCSIISLEGEDTAWNMDRSEHWLDWRISRSRQEISKLPLCLLVFCWGAAWHPAPAGLQMGELWQPWWRGGGQAATPHGTRSPLLVESDWGQLDSSAHPDQRWRLVWRSHWSTPPALPASSTNRSQQRAGEAAEVA